MRRTSARRDLRKGLAGLSIPLGEALPFDPVGPIGDRRLNAGFAGGKELAWVASRGRVEGVPDLPHRLEVVRTVHEGHKVDLLHPDPMLPCDTATDGKAELHDLRPGCNGPL